MLKRIWVGKGAGGCAPRTPAARAGRAALVATVIGIVFSTFAADPTISVEARQRYPWNGLVDLNFTITGTSGTKYDTSFTAKDMVGNTNITMATIRKSNGVAANASKESLLPGTYNWVWDAAADLPKNFQCDRVTVKGTAVEHKYLYMVVDLSSGSSSSSYPVSYLDSVPSGGWSDTYKTTKLVLRRIEPGTFKMCGQYNVKLTKAFYIGVFEVTQRQYTLIMGTNPSDYKGNKRPVENVSYNMIRGTSNGAKWPSSSAVDSTSVMGKLRTRTGFAFDLPTEAQWEYACRAGTTSDFNNGGNSENDLKKLGRYSKNVSDGKGGYSADYPQYCHTAVGSYLPNAWGLYDMHGNVFERCLDWYKSSLPSNVTDPTGGTGGTVRMARGGCWVSSYCTASFRWYNSPDLCNDTHATLYYGFRLCLTL